MLNCSKKSVPEEIHGTDSTNGLPKAVCKLAAPKPVVLSTQRYEKILTNAFQNEKMRAQKEAEENQKYREYLKKGSDELVAHFGTNLKKQEVVDTAKELDEERTKFNLSKENDEKIRRERIAKAQQLIEKLKPGPRELKSAALHSEVLRARNVQRNINAEFEQAMKQNNEKEICGRQILIGGKEEDKKIEEQKQQNNKYKQELMQTIKDKSKQRNEMKRQLLQEQLAEREAIDHEIKAQIEKEKAIMEKKRAMLRKNALEAMKMVEQRRQRERMTNEIEDRLCCNYNVGKRQLDAMRKEQIKQQQNERTQLVERSTKFLASLQQNMENQEDERLQRDISRMQLKFTAEEAEKKRKDKAAKQARIEAYIRELEQAKEARRREEEEARFDMAQRFKNSEVNCLFEQSIKEERERKSQELRAQFKEQLEARSKKAEKVDEESDQECMLQRNDKEDKFFFEYAKNLMKDAQRKDRPLYPFAKVVHDYKQKNQIDCSLSGDTTQQQRPHLASQLSTGRNQCEKEERIKPLSDDKKQILENCLKINQILTASGSDDNKYKKQCEQDSPIACVKPAQSEEREEEKNKERPVTFEEQEVYDKYKTKAANRCSKLSYTVNELKNMNQFSAPLN